MIREINCFVTGNQVFSYQCVECRAAYPRAGKEDIKKTEHQTWEEWAS